LLKGARKDIVVVADGKVVWTLIPAKHAYTELPARSGDIQMPVYILRIGNNDISGVDLLEEYDTLVAGRFRSISSYESSAKLKHSKALKVGKDKKQCYVLTIQMPGGSQKQKLWVDKTEFTVWKSEDTTLFPRDFWGDLFQTTVTVTTKQMSLNPSLDESNFVFTPPDRAKRVGSLTLSGSNPF
jgi:outer membrane lipoprotein-sorting protein